MQGKLTYFWWFYELSWWSKQYQTKFLYKRNSIELNRSRKTKHQEMMAQPLNFTYPSLWHLLENHLIESLHCPMFMINSVLLRNEHLWLLVPFLTNKCQCENSFKSLAKRLEPFLSEIIYYNQIAFVKWRSVLIWCSVDHPG